ncbi:hypothetical protein LX16_2668 [Stackebrandtia albiflava]|uniref:Glyoxalase-like domain-containing protein n=1 Tax=Stackebrandtia albiflava TaxID=406432 RepID=A0A562V284_9ACTN|nr:VOC family protein [Stackebrandtia albiflava]TWJ11927.1 hypothetical protein LX16_2668 [Stackebrandtia albiflava]
MTFQWSLTVDCADPAALARFWSLALGYVPKPPPEGFDSWEAWLLRHGVPEAEWDDGAYLCDPEGRLPGISFLKVPEGKSAKNRWHIDIPVGGGRAVPAARRWPRVEAAAERLVAAGAAILSRHDVDGVPDHLVMSDPEGNEFCLV